MVCSTGNYFVLIIVMMIMIVIIIIIITIFKLIRTREFLFFSKGHAPPSCQELSNHCNFGC